MWRASQVLVALILVASGTEAARADVAPAATETVALFDIRSTGAGIVTAHVNEAGLARIRLAAGAVVVPRVPVAPGRTLDLLVERMRVTHAGTRFVVGAAQAPLAFDPDRVTLLRGEVAGRPGSHAFIAIADDMTNGYIALPGGERYGIGSRGPGHALLPSGDVALYEVRPAGTSLPPGIAMCGTDGSGWTAPPAGGGGFDPRGGPPVHRLRQIQMAIETDYEFFSLYNDLAAAGTYVVELYGAISDIYIRDVNAEVMLSYVRLWDTPADLFNEPDPLSAFQNYWNTNMGAVVRDTAQFCSGRRNLPAGGVAYLNSLCNSSAYSWTGYNLGYFTDPAIPSEWTRDIMVNAHELGHNCGTPHTHDLGLDTCQIETSAPRRGTIMAYCGQTFTGGNANHDLWFHTTCQGLMQNYIASASCVVFDCNRNGISDAMDIAGGASADSNSDGIPDECQDCNGNGTLDPAEIAAGTSRDLNTNGLPDECEPDCNGNGTVDEADFVPGPGTTRFSDNFETDLGWTVTNLGATSGDWERGIPVNDPNWDYDPVSDADGSGQCYLTQNALGNTDVDNGATRLTSPRLDLSGGGWNMTYSYFLRLTDTTGGVDKLLLEGNDNDGAGTWRVLATHTTDGGLTWRTNTVSASAIAAAGLSQTSLFRVRFTINDANPQSIVEGGLDAFMVRRQSPPVSVDFNANNVPDECEGDCDGDGTADYTEVVADMSLDLNRNVVLDSCEDCDGDGTTDIAELNHSHNIWVAASEQSTIREYLAQFGTQTATSADAGVQEAQDLIITADRRILVSSKLDARVVEFNVSGAFVRTLVASGAGGLSAPATLLIAPTGHLLVASGGTNSVLRYDAASGAFAGTFVAAGAGGLVQPFGMAYGPNGNLFVTSSDGQVLEYNGATGAFVRVFVSSAANGGLSDPHGILWVPGRGTLLAASYGTDRVLEYNGTTGAFIRQFSQVGNGTVLTLDEPWCLRVGPDGGIYVSRYHQDAPIPDPGPGPAPLHLTNARVYHFDPVSGYFIRSFIMGVNSGLLHPTGFDFVPDAGTDCNNNQRPDNCDIAGGFSLDYNGNGVPDECECGNCPGDLTGDRLIDGADIDGFARALAGGVYHVCADMDGNGVLNPADAAAFVSVLLASGACP